MESARYMKVATNDVADKSSGRVTPTDITTMEMKEKNGVQNGTSSKGKSGDTDSKKSGEKEEAQPLVGVFEIFKYAEGKDVLFMILGTLSAMIHGSAFPVMIIVFGEMIDLFVQSGNFAEVAKNLSKYGILANLSATYNISLTYEGVIEDPSLLNNYENDIKTLSNGTVDFAAVREAVENDLLEVMQRFALYFIAIGCAVIVVGYGQVMFWMVASERQTHRIRKSFYRNVMRQNIGWFDTHESGEMNSRITNDISKIHEGIGDKLGAFTQWFCGGIAGFVVGFIYGWKLTLVILAISPLLAGAAFIMTKLVGLASSLELKAYARAGAVAEEVLGAIRTVVAFGGQEKECERYNANLTEARDLGVRKGLVNGLAMGVTWLIIFGAYALGFWYGAKLAREESDLYSIGDVMIVFFGVLIGAFSLGNAAPNVQSFAIARGAAYIVYQLIEQEPPIDSFSTAGERPQQLDGNIVMRNIYFNYPSRPDVKILKGVDLEISRGQTVALVGASGCGKSTIVQLIQRFYDPEQGSIRIDGRDIKDLNLKWWREHIGIVSQEPVLFGTTIKENIRYGRENVTDAEIEAATKMANAYDFIMKLPDKFETSVGERGAQLSGGQKQRIAIARALVRDPKILLLDEATSALDTESEGVVQEALEKASHGRTTIVIAHRLSTIKTADMIAGFKDGRIVEKGTHDELMTKNGIYYQLVTQQSMVSEDDIEAEMYDNPKSPLKAQKSVVDTPLKRVLSVKGEELKEDEKKKEEVNAGMGRILQLNASEWYLIALGLFGSIVNGGLMPAFAVIFAEILGVFSKPREEQEKDINLYCILFVSLGGISFITYFLQGYMFGRSGEYLTLRIRAMCFKAMLRQEITYFDDHENSVGALTTRLSTDASQVQGAAGIRLGSTLMSITSIVAGLVIGFIYSWKLTLLIIAFLPFLMIGGALQMKMLQGAAGKNKEALETAGKIAIESIENIRTVASLTREEMFYKMFCDELETPYNNALRKSHVIGISFSFSQGVIFFAYAAAFWLGAYLIKQAELDYVDVFKAFSAVVFGGMAIGQASSFAPDAAKAQSSASVIFKLLDLKPDIDSESTVGDQPKDCSSEVRFTNIKFKYPTRPDTVVLNQFNLDVLPGQTVALVGSSGCGKSTTVQLTERFYDPEDGVVYLDQHNIKDLNLQWYRRQIGIVSQEPVLFDRSIGENIAYGDNSRKVEMPEVIEAARKANIHEFIASLPEGYDTSVGEKGAQLSGGQKQRVAIARALVRNPKILLLDEATSALDTESEKIVQDALDAAREGRTSIVIAHRLSTIQNADKICVIRHGVITEMGTHSELMKQQGFYYKLNMAQQRKK
ncbi:ATP-dependent translocase ABCB1-like isoform X2 [Mercenaria mercenaria]|uniref:ATP-dependent translocase ABCB1-like isoform X2 n=1 Tax=Mercenaria mercenaria TaxID=6596 RepID=UPI00234ED466|nr:ATP-dependent translocase ABCB1-like isoform X2 [Mercenaria mercenaria]